MNKTYIWGVVLLIIVIAGFWFVSNKKDVDIEQEQVTNNQGYSGKLDIKVVCESALVYMTFSSGAEADVFVADCIDGKHPEVVDRYISDMNLGDGAAI